MLKYVEGQLGVNFEVLHQLKRNLLLFKIISPGLNGLVLIKKKSLPLRLVIFRCGSAMEIQTDRKATDKMDASELFTSRRPRNDPFYLLA